MAGVVDLLAVCIEDMLSLEHRRQTVRGQQLKPVALIKLVALGKNGVSVFVTAFHDRGNIRLGKIACLSVMLSGVAVVKPGAVRTVADLVSLVNPYLRYLVPRGNGVKRVAVCVGDDGGIL